MPQCQFDKQDGKRCRARAMRGAGLCFSHNPAAGESKRAAVRKGGKNRRVPKLASAPAQLVHLRTIQDVQELLFRTLGDLRNGAIDVEIARTLGYVAGVTAKLVESVDFDRRIRELEESLGDSAINEALAHVS